MTVELMNKNIFRELIFAESFMSSNLPLIIAQLRWGGGGGGRERGGEGGREGGREQVGERRTMRRGREGRWREGVEEEEGRKARRREEREVTLRVLVCAILPACCAGCAGEGDLCGCSEGKVWGCLVHVAVLMPAGVCVHMLSW